MVTFQVVATIVALGFGAAPAAKVDPAARTFVQGIYDAYVGRDAKGVALDKKSDVKRYFAPDLAKKILADRANAAKKGEVPSLDGDPFVDAQDWQIEKVDVSMGANASSTDRAMATVSFKNADTQQLVVLDLQKTKAGWRVSEVSVKGRTLSSLLKAH